jgi:SAM-dependent methyltransferase
LAFLIKKKWRAMKSPIDEDWFDLLCKSLAEPTISPRGDRLPAFPQDELQVRTVGSAGAPALREAWQFAKACIALFERSEKWDDRSKTLLDFGTAWGRVARCFLRDFSADRIVGADIDEELLQLARDTFIGPKFLLCSPLPPLGLPDASIDFVVGYSVFSHLSESVCEKWIAEFARILRRGGMVALTTRGRWFFDHARSLAGTDQYSQDLSRMFSDFNAARAKYDAGKFVHSNMEGVAGGGVRNSSFYGESFIPEKYARENYARYLRLTDFVTASGHPIMFFEKP